MYSIHFSGPWLFLFPGQYFADIKELSTKKAGSKIMTKNPLMTVSILGLNFKYLIEIKKKKQSNKSSSEQFKTNYQHYRLNASKLYQVFHFRQFFTSQILNKAHF